ncbi:STAS domain-containing protein (plasmid) [Burkholderia vietnamiensis]|uniref:SulP family inorganic anion transporter n=1 Tax=Burkholderia vietnamiensis TaxID=60552 RepID=UPI00201A1C7E|nr:SulP family inorganic anion transporter [Burkholderia vietnamiensis]MCO1349601.1 STAS domain-containing protein [Burkholderia vietnamiensis]MCO1432070.1 STAS domain-containing protein [Burkholderia vietnamiensis]UQN47752.1 STAS domain-containing protein [Burkholderia vietnamiensis]
MTTTQTRPEAGPQRAEHFAALDAAAPSPPRRVGLDALAGLSIAGLLIPEAVAYAGLANLPPQAGLIALLSGLVIYALTGSSRFAIVSSTSSSAAVLAATVLSESGLALAAQLALAAALVTVTGVLFILSGAARLGGMSDFVARPVLRGFTFGLALTIVIKQLPKILAVSVRHGDAPHVVLELVTGAPQANLASVALGAAALALLFALGRRSRVPATLVVIVLSIVAGYLVDWQRYGIAVVGHIDFRHIEFGLPRLDRNAWMQTVELAFALMLILYAESYGSIRNFALKHGDSVSANRDLVAIGCANLVSGLLHGMPVGAGYSATAANEAAGAQSRFAGLWAAAVVALIVGLLLPQLARTPEPVLAAIVIFAVSHSLHPSIFRPYWVWHRDRLVVIAALLAVLVLGVLHGLLVAIGVNLLLTLRKLSEPNVSVLGRLRDGHDFVDVANHADAKPVPGVLIVRPEAQLFFANADRMLNRVRALMKDAPDAHTVMLSLEETPDVDGTTIESLRTFAAECAARGLRLAIVRLKAHALNALRRAADDTLRDDAMSELSVDESLQLLQARGRDRASGG